MAKRAFKQFNEAEIINNWEYSRLPLTFCSDALTPAQALQAGAIFSYSNPRKGTADCTRTHKGFAEELHFSPATSARGIKSIKKLKAKDSSSILETPKQSTYRIDKSKINTRHIQIEKCIANHTFEFTNKTARQLSHGALILFSYITYKYKLLKNDKKKGVKASYTDFAEALGCCEKTITKYIDELISCGLITRGAHEKGLNGFKKSVYHPDSKLLEWIDDVRKREIKARRKGVDRAEEAAKAQERAKAEHERDKYYAELQEAAEHRAERNQEIANEDSEYVALDAELNNVKSGKGKYKMLSPYQRMLEIVRLNDLINNALRRYGLTESDLKPQYLCSECKDTGRMGNGHLCNCYPYTHSKDLQD